MLRKILLLLIFSLIVEINFISCSESSVNTTENIVTPGEMVLVQGGIFGMGAYLNEGSSDELPYHFVALDDFYIGKYEVTQGEWDSLMGSNPAHSYGVGANYPVYFVSWYEIIEFCNILSSSQGLTPCYTGSDSSIICDFDANGYRLPTEAEWEYAAKGGLNWRDQLRYSGCMEEIDLIHFAWYNSNNSISGVKEVGLKLPNQLGIYDMCGNLWESCWDWYNSDYYSTSGGTQSNPTGPTLGSLRIFRGGGWAFTAYLGRTSNRAYGEFNSPYMGFRVVRKAE